MSSKQDNLESAIREVLKKNNWDSSQEILLDLPQDKRFGDLSTNIALKLAKSAKKSPSQVAARIIQDLKESLSYEQGLKNYIQEIKVEGAGFINFYFTPEYFYEQLSGLLLKGIEAFRLDLGRAKEVLIEFVSANPTGPLSVAHARQAAVGDALANIMVFLGFQVKKEYYLNDEGNQINILGASVALRIKELNGEKIDFPENYYQGEYIYDIAKEVIRSPGPQVTSLSDYAADYILKIIAQELEDFGVRFDCWFSQKELGKSGKIQAALDELKKRGFLYQEEGALWFKSTAFGDDKDRVVIKSDGSFTYLAPDIAYHKDKYARGFKQLINLWGPDHHGYINRLKASVAALGEEANSLAVVIVQLATISRDGKPVQMSTRKGQYITLREVLDEVGRDASRFFFLMRKTSSHLDFDLEVAKKQTAENPVYYVQYAHARISSILNSAGDKFNAQKLNLSLLKEKEELDLIKKICQFNLNLTICAQTFDPFMLTVYLQELAESFHKFYDRHRVLGDSPELTQARLALISAARLVISEGLKLLGVSRPEKM